MHFSVRNLNLSVTISKVSPSIGLKGFLFLIFVLAKKVAIAVTDIASLFNGSSVKAAVLNSSSAYITISPNLYNPLNGSFKMTGILTLKRS